MTASNWLVNRVAIDGLEAWHFGGWDAAVRTAYPKAI